MKGAGVARAETWGGVAAWRIAKLRRLLEEAEMRGADVADDGAGLEHRALARRFAKGRRVVDAIGRNFGIFRALGRRSAYGPPSNRHWIAEFLLHYVSYGRLTDRQAEVLRHIAKRLDLPPPVRDGFVDATPRPARAPADRPARKPPKPAEIVRRLAKTEAVLRTGEVVTLLDLLEAGLVLRGERKTAAGKVLKAAVAGALAAEEEGADEEGDETG